MSFFFLKHPNCLNFGVDETEVKKTKQLKVLERNGKSNSKLCKMKDGTWCIKCGKIKMELVSTSTKPMRIAEKNEKGGKIIDIVNEKWFLKPNKELQNFFN